MEWLMAARVAEPNGYEVLEATGGNETEVDLLAFCGRVVLDYQCPG